VQIDPEMAEITPLQLWLEMCIRVSFGQFWGILTPQNCDVVVLNPRCMQFAQARVLRSLKSVHDVFCRLIQEALCYVKKLLVELRKDIGLWLEAPSNPIVSNSPSNSKYTQDLPV